MAKLMSSLVANGSPRLVGEGELELDGREPGRDQPDRRRRQPANQLERLGYQGCR